MNSMTFQGPASHGPDESKWRDRLTASMRQQPRVVPLSIALGLALMLGWIDSITSWEFSAFVFYGGPVLLASWWVGPKAGQLFAALSAGLWCAANQSSHPYETGLGYAWAAVSRWIFFMVVAWSAHSVRKQREADATQIRLLKERRQLERDIVAASEHEQQRIGQDLHDGLCQQLAAISCAQHLLTRDLQGQGNALSGDSGLIEEAIRMAVVDTRNLARGIFPVQMDRNGLSAALEDLAIMAGRLTNAAISYEESAGVDALDPEAAMHCYRIAQEAVANSLRHGKASQILISLQRGPAHLQLLISDNGCGLAAATNQTGKGMGLRTMQYRAQAMDAELSIKPGPAGGTLVSCRIPLPLPATPAPP